MAIFFTADLHFGHRAMLNLGIRDYPDVDSMDAALVTNWNNTVGLYDEVYILGDVSFRNNAATYDIVTSLHGRLYLLRGNHDKLSALVRSEFEWEKDYHVLKVQHPESRTNLRIVLSHYAFRTWDAMHYGSWNLHGHSHGTLESRGKQLDVGVDSAKRLLGQHRPFSLLEIADIMQSRSVFSEDPTSQRATNTALSPRA